MQMGIADFVLDVAVGISLTHLYKTFARKKNWQALDLKALLPRIVPAIIMLSLLYMILIIGKLYLNRMIFEPVILTSFEEFFAFNWLTIFITGTRLMSIWILAYHLYHYAQREIKITKENAHLAVVAKEAQLNNLSSQLNPHFFFNSLSNIKFLVTENPESARRAIDLLSDLLRSSLYAKDDRLIPLEEEISLVKDYLELEKLRFEERLQINIPTKEELPGISIPPLSIQALVENAIKHGIEKRKNGGLVEIKTERNKEGVVITVQNEGKIDTQKQSKGLGLKNLKERLQLQYNGKATFNLKELEEEKVIATILIPVI